MTFTAKLCKTCRTVKPHDCFASNGSNSDGTKKLKTDCKDCAAAKRQHYRLQRKIREAIRPDETPPMISWPVMRFEDIKLDRWDRPI